MMVVGFGWDKWRWSEKLGEDGGERRRERVVEVDGAWRWGEGGVWVSGERRAMVVVVVGGGARCIEKVEGVVVKGLLDGACTCAVIRHRGPRSAPTGSDGLQPGR